MSLADDANLLLIPTGYKAEKLYSIFPTSGVGDFDFARTTSATRVAKNGFITTVGTNVPRLNYDILDGEVVGCPHLLLEPARTNIITYSEDFSNAWWLKLNNVTVSAEKVISPDGTLNASQLIFDGTSGGRIEKGLTGLTQGADYSVSVYARVSSGTQVVNFGSVNDFEYTLTTEWKRLTSTEAENDSAGFPRLKCNDAATIEVWGFQLEQGSYPTSYIKSNSGSPTTRAAETCNGSGNAATFNDSEGVLMAEISALANDNTGRKITLNNGSNSQVVVLEYTSTSNQIRVFLSNGSLQFNEFITISDLTEFNKIAIKYKENDSAIWVNGIELATSLIGTTFSSGTLTSINFDDGSGFADFYGKTKQIQYHSTVLSDSNLEKLTSWTSFNEMAEAQLYSIQ